jgi:hypothetical protein
MTGNRLTANETGRSFGSGQWFTPALDRCISLLRLERNDFKHIVGYRRRASGEKEVHLPVVLASLVVR